MFDRARYTLRRLNEEVISSYYSHCWRSKRKSLSALVRVRDGEEFLMPSVASIISFVDEVVVIDNLSRDNTPNVINLLKERYPGKIISFRYDHNVVKVGEESAVLYASNPSSPCLLHNYYNWCMSLCRSSFVLKWDDDMIACDKLIQEIENFKTSKYIQYDFGGFNISPDYKYILTWDAGIEPRVFPLTTKFRMVDYGEVLNKPKQGKYFGESPTNLVSKKFTYRTSTPMYAHLKYCKKDPGSNQSTEFRLQLEKSIEIGELIPSNLRSLLRYHLGDIVK